MATEEVFTAREVASALGLAGAMLRRYAATYEELTGSEIGVHKREGRLFSRDQLDTLLKARNLVSTQGLSVRAAMQIAVAKDDPSGVLKHALRRAESRSKPPSRSDAPEDALALKEMLTEALRNAVIDANKPLLEEMRLLRASLESNSNPKLQFRKLEIEENPAKHGLFVRFAMWVERLIKS
jgi:hypothetical protein